MASRIPGGVKDRILLRPWVWPGRWWSMVALALAGPSLWFGWAPLEAVASWPSSQAALALRPVLGLEQPLTTWWTAAWIHGSRAHWLSNLLACLLIGLMGVLMRAGGGAAAAWALAWPTTHALLLLDPRLAVYVGASGVLHAGIAVLSVHAWQGGRKHLGLAILAALSIKMAFEVSLGLPLAVRAGLDVPLAPLSHVAGTLSGLLFAGIHGAIKRFKP